MSLELLYKLSKDKCLNNYDLSSITPFSLEGEKQHINSCIISSYLKTLGETKGFPKGDLNLQSVFYPLEPLTDSLTSAEGIIAISGIMGSEKFINIKYPKKENDEESLLYEITFGTALNRLRKHIPNFRYIYGGFYCGIPMNPDFSNFEIDEKFKKQLDDLIQNINLTMIHPDLVGHVLSNEIITKENVVKFLKDEAMKFLKNNNDSRVKTAVLNLTNEGTQNFIFDKVSKYKAEYELAKELASDFDKNLFCSENNERIMMLSEFIPDSNTVLNLYNKLTRDELFNIFCQVAFSLNMAWREFRYCHSDLHYKNILIRELDDEITINYSVLISGGKIIDVPLKTRKLAVIIDYSYSKINLEGKIYTQNIYNQDNNSDLENLFLEKTNIDDKLTEFTNIGNNEKLRDDEFSPRLYGEFVKILLY